MIRRSPCEAYLKYLIVHPDRYDNDFIRQLIRSKHLDFIGIPYLDRLREVCVPPTPFYPEDTSHHKSQRFLRKEKIYGLFHPSDDALGARAILNTPKAKERAETMLLSHSSLAWVRVGIRRVGLDVAEGAVRLFKRFYFNVDLVDTSELRALIRLRHVHDGTRDTDESTLSTIVLKQIKQDPRELVLQSNVAPLAGMMQSLRMGILPSNVDVGRLVSAARVAGVTNLVESLVLGHAERSRDFALVVKALTEVMEHVGDPDSDLEEGLQKLALKTESREVPHINQLTDGGSYTAEVLPQGEEDIHVE